MISDIYLALSEMAVPDVAARNLDALELEVRADDCPVRLLLPNTVGEQGFVAIGSMTNTQWQVRDLCLWQPVVMGTGIEQCAAELVTYVEQYGAAIRALRRPTPESNVVSVVFKLGTALWRDDTYWAVDVLVNLEEIAQ